MAANENCHDDEKDALLESKAGGLPNYTKFFLTSLSTNQLSLLTVARGAEHFSTLVITTECANAKCIGLIGSACYFPDEYMVG